MTIPTSLFAAPEPVALNPSLGSPSVALQSSLSDSILASRARATSNAQFAQQQALRVRAQTDTETAQRDRKSYMDAESSLARANAGRAAAEMGYLHAQHAQANADTDFQAMAAAGATGDLDQQRFLADKLRNSGYTVQGPDVRAPQAAPGSTGPAPAAGPSASDVVRSDQMLSAGDSFNAPGSPTAAATPAPRPQVKSDIGKASSADAKLSHDLDSDAESTIRKMKGTGAPKTVMPAPAPPPDATETISSPSEAGASQADTTMMNQLNQADQAYSKGLGVAPSAPGALPPPTAAFPAQAVPTGSPAAPPPPPVSAPPAPAPPMPSPPAPAPPVSAPPAPAPPMPSPPMPSPAPGAPNPQAPPASAPAAPPPAPSGGAPAVGAPRMLPGMSAVPTMPRAAAPAPSSQAVAAADALPPIGAPGLDNAFRIFKAGKLIHTIPVSPQATLGHQASEVTKIGDALLLHADTPELQAVAKRTQDFGMSLVGTMPAADIQKAMVHRYDTDTKNDLSVKLEGMKASASIRAAAARAGDGPTKQEKFDHELNSDMWKRINPVIANTKSQAKYSALAADENSVVRAMSLMSGPNAMGQRIAVQLALKDLTGKNSRQDEQSSLTGAAGKFEQIRNKLALWTTDPTLGPKYIAEFRGMLKETQDYIDQQRGELAKQTANAVYAETYDYPEDQRRLAYDTAYGMVSGKYAGSAAYNPAPPQSHPTGSADAQAAALLGGTR